MILVRLIFGAIGLLSIISGHTQDFTSRTHKNTLYGEVSNRSAIYSINYDRVFAAGKTLSWSYRIGLSYWDHDAAIPIGISVFTGKSKHHAEFNFTVTPYIDRANYLFRAGNYSDKNAWFSPAVGYRFQQPGGGLFLRALAGPALYVDPRSDNFWAMDPKWFGQFSIAAGFSF